MDETESSGGLEKEIVTGLNAWLGKRNAGFNMWTVAKLMATVESASYLTKSMLKAKSISSRAKIEMYGPTICTISGLNLEFGVAGGISINRIATLFDGSKIYGFDGFEGLPETWRPDHPAGMFAQNVPEVASNVELVVGWFEDTLPRFVDEHKEDVSFLHVDCDLYSSTKTIFNFLGDRIKPGTVILFDEYMNYPGWEQHEYKAFQELVVDHNLTYEYLAFVPSNKQVLVRIT